MRTSTPGKIRVASYTAASAAVQPCRIQLDRHRTAVGPTGLYLGGRADGKVGADPAPFAPQDQPRLLGRERLGCAVRDRGQEVGLLGRTGADCAVGAGCAGQ